MNRLKIANLRQIAICGFRTDPSVPLLLISSVLVLGHGVPAVGQDASPAQAATQALVEPPDLCPETFSPRVQNRSQITSTPDSDVVNGLRPDATPAQAIKPRGARFAIHGVVWRPPRQFTTPPLIGPYPVSIRFDELTGEPYPSYGPSGLSEPLPRAQSNTDCQPLNTHSGTTAVPLLKCDAIAIRKASWHARECGKCSEELRKDGF